MTRSSSARSSRISLRSAGDGAPSGLLAGLPNAVAERGRSLLRSSVVASTAFVEHFADDGNRVRDLAGSVALLVAAAMLGWTVVTTRSASAVASVTLRDLTTMSGVATVAALVVAAGLLLTPGKSTARITTFDTTRSAHSWRSASRRRRPAFL